MDINAPVMKFLSIVFLAVIISACKDKSDPIPAFSVKLGDTGNLGSVLTDSDGRTLYYFANDFDGKSACTGSCVTIWPVFHRDERAPIHSDLTASDFATVTRPDGLIQTTYKGWPLYYYAPGGKAEAAGNTQGQNVDGTWFVMKKDYGIMFSNTQLIGNDGNHYKSDFTRGDGMTKYFTDDHGRTIYLWTHDFYRTNEFTAHDYSNNAVWPIFYADINSLSLSGNLDKSDFVEIQVGNENRKQLTYKGWPLYYFGQDTQRGDNKGVSMPPTGPLWRVVNTETPGATK